MIYSLPVIAALIGWFTNYLAVRMIFRPRHPWKVLGLTFQGLLPKRRHELAASIAETVDRHLFSVDDIRSMLTEPRVQQKLHSAVSEHVDRFLREKLGRLNPMIGAFLQGALLEQVKGMLSEQLEEAVAEMLGTLGDHLEESVDLAAVVRERVEGFDLARLEEIVLAVARKELRAIEILGAILGFLIGLVQLLLVRLGAM